MDYQLKTIQDYMEQAAEMANHQRLHTRRLVASELGVPKVINFLEVEAAMFSTQEKAIYSTLDMDDMFCKSGMARELMLSVNMVADSKKYSRQLFNATKAKITFESDVEWYLDPMQANAYASERQLGSAISDQIIQGNINSSFRHLTGSEASGLFITGAINKLNLVQDMRHMFSKMYLLLCDYNLACASRIDSVQVSEDINLSVHNNVTPLARLEIMSRYNVVVDATNFTPAELGLLKLAGCEYPSVRYAGSNIYTCCNMAKDTVAIVSDNVVNMDTSLSWGSPSRLYDLMCSLACKMGCVDDMVESFTSMRGMCQLMKSVFTNSENDTVVSDMPLSKSYKCCTGQRPKEAVTMGKRGGLFASSKALVSEVILGNMGEVVASNFLEEIGAYGELFGSQVPSTSKNLNGFMRDYGLNHSDCKVNSILYQWQNVYGRRIKWGFGLAIKDYALNLAQAVRAHSDIDLPQLQFLLHMNEYKNTCWGMIRHWNGTGDSFASKKDNVVSRQQTAAFTWVMGVRERRPMVMANKKNDKESTISAKEWSFLCGNKGLDYQLDSMGICLDETVGTRIDELEVTARALVSSTFIKAGTMITYDPSSGWGFPEATDRNAKYDEDRLMRSFGGALKEGYPVPESVADNDENDPELYDIPLKVDSSDKTSSDLSKMEPFDQLPVLSMERRHIRMSDENESRVQPYRVNGREYTDALPLYEKLAVQGDAMDYSLIENDVKGRGAYPAMMKDLSIRGMCTTADYQKVCRDAGRVDSAIGPVVDEEEVAKLAEAFKLDVTIFEEKNGQLRAKQTEMGHKHRVNLMKEGEEYHAIVPKQGSRAKVTEVANAKKTKTESGWKFW